MDFILLAVNEKHSFTDTVNYLESTFGKRGLLRAEEHLLNIRVQAAQPLFVLVERKVYLRVSTWRPIAAPLDYFRAGGNISIPQILSSPPPCTQLSSHRY